MTLSLEIPPELVEEVATRAAELVEQRSDRCPWLTTKQAAEHLACPPSRIYDLVGLGKLPVYKDGSRSVYRREDLDACLERIG